MGGFKYLGDAFAEAAGEVFENFGKVFKGPESSKIFWRESGEALLKQTPEGAVWNDFLKNTYEPNVGKTGQHMLSQVQSAGLTPAQMTKKLHGIGKDSMNLNRSIYFGKNDEALVKFMADIRKKYGKSYADAVADFHDVYFSDAHSYWRNKKVVLQPGVRLSVADMDIRDKGQYVPPRDFENGLRRIMSWANTQMVAIPHLSQGVNILFNEGVGPTAKALSQWTKMLVSTGRPDKAFKDVIDSGALFHEFVYEALNDAKNPGAALASRLINAPAFNWTRRQYITMAALAAKKTLFDATKELSNNIDVKWNTSELQRLGINVSDLRNRGWQLSQDDIHTAMYRGADESMFLKTERMTPWKWNENFGMRALTWYRGWSFRETKMLKDGFIRAYKDGGPTELAKKIAVLGIAFPLAGEFVRQLENVAQGRGLDNPLAPDEKGETHYTEAYFNAMAHAAGWAIYHSMFRAGMKGYMTMGNWLAGPVIHNISDIGIAGWHVTRGLEYEFGEDQDEDKAAKQFRQAARIFVSKFGIPGRVASNVFLQDPDKGTI